MGLPQNPRVSIAPILFTVISAGYGAYKVIIVEERELNYSDTEGILGNTVDSP